MDREALILREIVETHIASGEAVGSKTIAQRLGNELSSASIRAIMATLGQRGLLVQPHTSAGRVPTDLGYREYLAELGPVHPRPRDKARVEQLAWHEGESATDVMREAASAVGHELGAAAVVVAPRLEQSSLQRLDLVYLGRGRVLAVAVTAAGVVHERLLVVEPDLDRRELERFTNYLDTLLPGRTLAEVRAALEDAQREDRDALERRAAAIGQRALDGVEADTEILVEGASRVLAAREFAEQPEKAAELMRALEERAAWLALLERLAAADDTRIYLGDEIGVPGLSPCGLLVRRYRVGDRPGGGGIMVLLGPKRLDYRRGIPLLGLVARRLGEVLAL
ncbi:MAG: heat-inducible transcription repressor HrcA [Deltaproteobacteria bacterium]|nr:heat-inducible transcription repressor HrcA [Deltaproteobacteria bacterium]